MFWECFRYPIYMHLCHIFFVSIYFQNLSSPSLMVRWLVENWRCNMYYLGLAHLFTSHFASQLLPICCQYMYANFVSVVRGALCIIMTSPFIPYPSTCLER